MADVTFKDRATAEKFVRYVAAGGLAGCSDWDTDKWFKKARWFARALPAERVALAVRAVRGKGVAFSGVHCRCCGTPLTAPDSVAAGIGPRCQSS